MSAVAQQEKDEFELRERTDQTLKEPAQYRVFLAPHRGDPLTGPLGWLAKKYDLDVHGPTRLGRRAGKEMGYVALLLTVIFLFDLAAWSVLWNTIFHSGRLTFSAATLLAIAIAAVFSAATFVYERQFMTADTSGGFKKLWKPVTIRFGVILVAAGVTTQPVEIIVFHGPIQRRAHEESIRIEAAHRLTELDKAQKIAAHESELAGTVESEDKKKAEERATAAQNDRRRMEVTLGQLRAQLSGTQSALARARRNRATARTSEERQAWNRRVASLEASASSLSSRLEQAQIDVAVKSKEADDAGEIRKDAANKVAALQQAARDKVARLHDWITQLDNAEPGTQVIEAAERSDRWTFRDQTYDFFERLTVLNDLYHGRPPRWKHTTQEDRERLAETFGLKDIAKEDQEAKDRLANDAALFKVSYWAVVGIAIVIPFLSLAFKKLLPDELKDYYATRSQWEAGNYEARKYCRLDKEPPVIAVRRHEMRPQAEFE
jgi:hypothetical protein